MLEDLADLIDPLEHAELAESAASAQTDAQCRFAWVSAYMSAIILVGKLTLRPITMKKARALAHKAR